MNEFKKIGLGEGIVKILEEMKFDEPTEIQLKSIPLMMKGMDVIGHAATGSGKTLAFASRIIEEIEPGKGIQALVMTPTRELAEQIAKVTRDFSKNTGIEVCEIFGGVSLSGQVVKSRDADIVVGTPGRILDHLGRGTFDFSRVKILVLDEADRMAGMGFLPDVEKIISQCPKKRQTLLFSATSSQDISYISKKYMTNPVEVFVEQYIDSSKLVQYYFDAPLNVKFSLLVHLLKREQNSGSGIVMIFCNTRRNVDLVVKNLQRYKINALAIHGGMDQKKRSRMIEVLHTDKTNFLVCTDVAARGLDIKGVTHVYNYDICRSPEEYIHRVGRTARAGEKGLAISLVASNDYDNFGRVMDDDSLSIAKQEMPEIEILTPKFKDEGRDSRRGSGRFSGNRGGKPIGSSRGGYRRDSGRVDSRGPRRDSGRRNSGNGKRGDSRGSRGSHSGGGRRDSGRGRGNQRRDSRRVSRRRSNRR
jgi:ATP-dependent RNA helicase DeaD